MQSTVMPLNAEDFINGKLLLVDKPLEWTSFDVVNFLRSFIGKTYGIKKLKVGHAGTLDPLATGLLIICTGKKTKEIDNYQGMDKVYIGSLHLGATTPSYDGETEINEEFKTDHITQEQLQEATLPFVGEIDQVPPIYSAIKVDGKRAFNLARKNETVVLKSRKVHIKTFQLLNIDLPRIDFAVECTKGTYIRSLVHDYGKALENGAYLTELRRTQIGDFNVNDAFTLEQFKESVLNNSELI